MRMSVAALMCTVAVVVTAQDYPAGQVKHISLPVVNSAKPFAVSAREIDRDVPYPAVIHLKGAVEIKMPVCVVTGPGTGQKCAEKLSSTPTKPISTRILDRSKQRVRLGLLANSDPAYPALVEVREIGCFRNRRFPMVIGKQRQPDRRYHLP